MERITKGAFHFHTQPMNERTRQIAEISSVTDLGSVRVFEIAKNNNKGVQWRVNNEKSSRYLESTIFILYIKHIKVYGMVNVCILFYK